MRMAGKVFLQILNMSYTASYVIIFIMIARLFLKKAPKVFSYILWSVVLFRLICPYTFASVWSLIPEKTTALPIEVNYFIPEQISTNLTATITANTANNTTADPVLPVQAVSSDINNYQGFITIGVIIWLIGIIVLLSYSVISLLRLRWKLVGAIKHRGNIYFADYISSPFVLGVIRPKIYLPSTLTEQEQRYTILHEQAHIRRRDHLFKILAFFVLTLHWFNPLVWGAFMLFSNDMEMSCDETVMKHMDTDIRRDYSKLLLGLATGRKVVMGVPLAFSEGDIKERIKNVMSYKKPAFGVILLTLISVIIVVTGLALNPHTEKASMQWAKNLKVQEVGKIELVTTPKGQSQFQDNSEFEGIVKLINESRGKYIKNPEAIVGEIITYNITLADGTSHVVSNSGNRYLIIDNDYYDAGYNWLVTWNTDGSIITPLPSSKPTPTPSPSLPVITGYSDRSLQFNYPSDWTIKDNPTEDVSYVSFYNADSQEDPVFWFSKGEAWLTDFNRTEKDYKTLLSEGYTDSNITSLIKTMIDGYDAIKLVFTYTQKDKEYVMIQYETVIDSASFWFNYTYPSEKSTENKNIMEDIISSIKFTKGKTEAAASINAGSIEDYAEEDIIKYLTTPTGLLLKQTADSYVKAYFQGEEDTINQYLANGADLSGSKVYQIDGETVDVYDKMTHLLAKWYTASDETANVQYEFSIEGEDSNTYMDLQLVYSDGKWLVTEMYFER